MKKTVYEYGMLGEFNTLYDSDGNLKKIVIKVDKDDPNFIMNLSDTMILLTNDQCIDGQYTYWKVLQQLNDEGHIHLGMRRVTYDLVKQMDYITLNTYKGKVWIVIKDSAKDYYHQQIFDNIKEVPEIKIPDYDIIDLKDFGDEHIKKLERGYLGWDYETHGFPLRPGFYALGFSLSGDNYCVYIDMRKYRNTKDPVYDKLKNFIIENQRRLITYNCQFEMQCFMHQFEVVLRPYDAMVMVICDEYLTNLKCASQRYLHVASWDDELDDEMNMWEQILDKSCTNRQEILNKIISDRVEKSGLSEEEVRKIYRENVKVVGYDNSWSLAFPPTLAKYCILDAYYTKLIFEKLEKPYANAIEVFHKNFWYGALIHSSYIPMNRDLLEVITKNNRNLHRISKLNVLSRYLHFLEYNLKDYISQMNITPEIDNILKYCPESLALDPVKQLKEIVKSANSKGDTKYEVIKNIYGPEFYVKFIGEFPNLDPENYLRSRKCWTNLSRYISDTSGLIKRWNSLMLKEVGIDNINNWNKGIKETLDSIGTNPTNYTKVLVNVTVRSKTDPGMIARFENIDKEEVKRILEFFEDNKIEMRKSNNVFTPNYHEVFKLREESVINMEDLKKNLSTTLSILDYIPSFLMSETGCKPIFNFKCFLDYYKLKQHKEFLSTIQDYPATAEIDDSSFSDWEDFYSASAQQKWDIFWNAFIYHKRSAVFNFKMYEFFNQLGNDPEKFTKENYEEFLNSIFNLSDDVINKIIYDHMRLGDYTDIELIPNCNSYPLLSSGATTSALHKFDLLTGGDDEIPSCKDVTYKYDKGGSVNDVKDFRRFLLFYKLETSTDKEMNPYLKTFNENSYSLIRDSRDGCIIDESKPGNAYTCRFEVCQKTTKRWSSFFHTISPKGEDQAPIEVPEGYIMSYADVSQMEVRGMAYLSKDPQFMADYDAGKDVYMELCKAHFKDRYSDEYLKEVYRPYFKTLLLGTHYGMSVASLAARLSISIEEARELQNAYFARYPKAKEFIDEAVNYARETGLIKTIFGDKITVDKGAENRQGINYILQGSCSLAAISGFSDSLFAARDYGINIRPIGTRI